MRAAAARIIPTDTEGPGATEAGVVTFIDRQLASDYGLHGPEYRLGPFRAGSETQSDQSSLFMRERYRLGVAATDAYARKRFLRGFAELASERQDEVLRAMDIGEADQEIDLSSLQGIQHTSVQRAGGGTEASIQTAGPAGVVYGLQAFFQLLRAHTIAGFFSDPIHGGNRGPPRWPRPRGARRPRRLRCAGATDAANTAGTR